jgi:uncharacterized membrane protein HdeD (DUF308 family)
MPVRHWWLLVLCGAIDFAIAVIYLAMAGTDGPVLSHSWIGTFELVGKLAMTAGACSVVAALWRGRNWALALNGLALAALGYIQYALTRFPISISVVALLIAVAAVTTGVVQFAMARASRRERRSIESRFFTSAGIASVSFVVLSLAFGLRLVPMGPGSHLDLLWLGSYFAFAAVCTVVLALRLRQPVSTLWG